MFAATLKLLRFSRYTWHSKGAGRVVKHSAGVRRTMVPVMACRLNAVERIFHTSVYVTEELTYLVPSSLDPSLRHPIPRLTSDSTAPSPSRRMASTTFLLLLLSSPTLSYGLDWSSLSNILSRRADTTRKVPDLGYYNPTDNGGSFLTKIPVTFPMGQGEPVNAIISGHSDNDVLVDSELNGGLRNYFSSLGFSSECLGQRSVSNQKVNLGDGKGYLNETAVIRWDYGDPQLGTCKETIQGGNHFRYWVQDGPQANSGAIFMAVSYEMPLAKQHDIIPNGYNLARDWLIGNITQSTIPTTELTNTSTYSGSTSANGYTYQSDVAYVSGLLANTSDAINHNITVAVDGQNAVDGLVAVFNVRITKRPQTASAAASSIPIWFIPLTSLLILLPLLTP
ncbi:hypothetical protein FPV67DRAFT_778304 [Lyophyllum atratum]|nr:hypothetical protein FPV67DRAFT_778304 [Lyophyllum atratum]